MKHHEVATPNQVNKNRMLNIYFLTSFGPRRNRCDVIEFQFSDAKLIRIRDIARHRFVKLFLDDED